MPDDDPLIRDRIQQAIEQTDLDSITSLLDPNARVADRPSSSPPTPAAPAASPLSNLGRQLGMTSGMLGLASAWKPMSSFITNVPGMSYAIPGLSAVTGGLGLFTGVFGMARNGVTAGGLLSTGMSFVGAVTGAATIAGTIAAASAAATASAAAAASTAAAAALGSAIASGSAAAVSAAAATAASAGLTATAAGATAASASASIGSFASMAAMMTNPVTLAILAGIVVVALILGLLGRKPSTQEKGFINFNKELTLWHPGRLVVITAASLTTMGVLGSLITQPNASQTPQTVSTTLVRNQLLGRMQVAQGEALKPGEIPYRTPILIQGQDGRIERMMIVDPASGTQDRMQVYDLNKEYNFAAPNTPDKLYIPLFVNDQPNPQALTSIGTQRSLLTSCLSGALDPARCQTAIVLAGAMNKNVTPIPKTNSTGLY